MKKTLITILVLNIFLIDLALAQPVDQNDPYRFPEEKRLKNIRMLTNGGENAEAYLSFDETKLVFQSTRDELKCDQIFTMNIDGTEQKMVSTGLGRTTCAYFLPGDTLILYASTHHYDKNCPPTPDRFC